MPGLAQRMAAMMCVDVDSNSDAEEIDGDGVSRDNYSKLNVTDIVENEIGYAKERGHDTVKWLELEELDIDDDMLLSLDLSSKFPVCHHYCPWLFVFYYGKSQLLQKLFEKQYVWFKEIHWI